MIDQEIAKKIRFLAENHDKDYGLWVREALKQDFLDELLDFIYDLGAELSPKIVGEQLESYYLENVSLSKEKKQDKVKVNYLINKYQYLLMKTTFETKK